jgi:hypothetical protein
MKAGGLTNSQKYVILLSTKETIQNECVGSLGKGEIYGWIQTKKLAATFNA